MWPPTTALPCTQRSDGNLPIETQFFYVNPQNENGADLPSENYKNQIFQFCESHLTNARNWLGKIFLVFCGVYGANYCVFVLTLSEFENGFSSSGQVGTISSSGQVGTISSFLIYYG